MSTRRKGIVVGVDFGTATSGIAFLHDVSTSAPDVFGPYEEQPAGNPYPKQPTVLRYDITDPARPLLLAIGWAAVNWTRGGQNHIVIREPKLALDPTRRCPLDIPAEVRLTAQRVVGDYLGKLRELTEQYLRDTYRHGTTTIADVRWCLTVPACWTDREKASMRQAAADARMIDSVNAPMEKFCMVLEPEAAAIALLHQSTLALETGATFMVVDAGGGTVDITSHRVAQGLADGFVLRELSRSTDRSRLAELCGSGHVDREWRKWLIEGLGEAAVTAFLNHQCHIDCTSEHKKTCSTLTAARDFRLHWETIKCNTKRPLETRYLPLPSGLRRLARGFNAKKFASFVAQHGGNEEDIEISPQEMEQFFQPVLSQIGDLIARQWRAGAVDMVLVVGGFAQSPLLREAVTRAVQRCSRECEVIFPTRPASAVLEGAAYYGRQPAVIHSRRTTRFYGVTAGRAAKESDPARHCYDVEGRGRWCNYFMEFVKQNQEVPVDTKITHPLRPLTATQTTASIQVVSSDREIEYSDDPGAQTEQTITLEMPDTTGGLERELEVEFHFGTSEIAVSSREKKAGGNVTQPRSILFCHHIG